MQCRTTDGALRVRSHIATPSGTNEIPSMSENSKTYPIRLTSSLSTLNVALDGHESHPALSRYELRTRNINTCVDTIQIQASYTFQGTLSEFRPHIKEPSFSDSVYQKMLDPLEDRDFETGALYIFDRTSSPGHVKIGWTAKVVKDRLKAWSKCGYEPNLLFSLSHVPHAQRVETLTHHELIKEWRRERKCKAPQCGKSHQEWFEVNQKKAEQVLSDWAEFISEAKPYHSNGQLKSQWEILIAKIDRKMTDITAEQLLDYYKMTLIDELKVLKEQVDLSRGPKIIEASTGHYANLMQRKANKRECVCINLPETGYLSLPEDTTLLKSEASYNVPKANTLIPSKQSWGTRSINGEVSTPSVAPVKKELAPEEIPLPPSPLLEYATLQVINPAI